MTVRVIRAGERYHWSNEWLDSWQSFPSLGNFDLTEHAHGVLVTHNDDRVDAGEGFDTHQHKDMEILTWVLEGSLRHKDSQGGEGTIVPGMIQRMTAGRGIRHSERNGSTRRENARLHVVQMWVAPEYAGLDPGYAERDFTAELATGELVTVASGMPDHADTTAITLANSYAALHIARPSAGQPITLPPARYGHLFMTHGTVNIDGLGTLGVGDAVRFTDSPPTTVTADSPAEVLYWEMHTSHADH